MVNQAHPFIEVKNLIKIFGNNPKKALPLICHNYTRMEIKKKTGQLIGLYNLNFEIHEGEIFVIMGLSGSGKSTLLRCFNQLISVTSGGIYIQGVDITTLSLKEIRKMRLSQISMVFQNFALFPHRTLLENIEYGLELNHIPKKEREHLALEALETVKLGDWAHVYPHQVSGGMKQRIGLARSLVLNPKIILMDEAFSALDPLIKSEMQDELIEIQKIKKNTIIFVSHDLNEALKIAHRILILKEGRIMQCGTPEEILSKPSNEYVEKFVENADLSKVLSASSLMRKPTSVGYLNQGPRMALCKMEHADISKMYIVENEKKKLLGYVTIEDVVRAITRNEKDLTTILRKDFVAVDSDTQAYELLEKILVAPLAVAVVSEIGNLQGIITKSHLIAGLGKKEVLI